MNPELKIQDYASWQERFWQYESLRPLIDKRESYDFRGWVEMNPIAECLINQLSEHLEGYRHSQLMEIKPPQKYAELDDGWKQEKKRQIQVLEDHLQMIKGIKPYDSNTRSPHKYRLIDNDTRHQLMVRRMGLDSDEIRDALSSNYILMLDVTKRH